MSAQGMPKMERSIPYPVDITGTQDERQFSPETMKENPETTKEGSPNTDGMPIPLKHRKVDHVHKLERKHSSGDLHSRLKTRKLLGVGETDDGDVHRSKLSQILGHSEQLYTRKPRGLWAWQLLLAVTFTVISIWALLFPKSLFKFAVHQDGEDAIILPIRLYGAALLSFSIVFWSTLQAQDKDVIRWALIGSTVYFFIQILVITISLVEAGTLRDTWRSALCHHVICGALSGYYSYCLHDAKLYRNRRSNSTHDLSTGPSTSPKHLKKDN